MSTAGNMHEVGITRTLVEVGDAVVAIGDPARRAVLSDALGSARYRLIDEATMLRSRAAAVVALCDRRDDTRLARLVTAARSNPAIRIVALTEPGADIEAVITSIACGVSGVCRADASIDAIVRTVDDVRTTGTGIPRDLVGPLIAHLQRRRVFRVTTERGSVELSEREWDVLQQLLQRRSTREIAARTYMSVGTVRSHIWSIMRKLGAADREQAIELVLQSDLA